MKKAALLFLLFIGQAVIAHASTQCSQHFAAGRPPVFTNEKLAAKTTPLCFEGFAVMHSGISRTPLWSAQHLTGERIREAKAIRRRNAFHPEERLPAGHRAELSDYARSGFDRGHLAPAADMASENAQYESFSLANIVPQDPHNNQNLWAGIEEITRSYTLSSGDIYVITGPIFEGNSLQRLKGRVLVPTHMFKAVYHPARGQAGAYISRNAPGLEYEIISIAELEQRTGFNLFPALPQEIKKTPARLPHPKIRERRQRRAESKQ